MFSQVAQIFAASRRRRRDALVNCLILSRCDALLKTASILSGWSKLFNPQLPVSMMSAPYEEYLWFPERDIVGSSR